MHSKVQLGIVKHTILQIIIVILYINTKETATWCHLDLPRGNTRTSLADLTYCLLKLLSHSKIDRYIHINMMEPSVISKKETT